MQNTKHKTQNTKHKTQNTKHKTLANFFGLCKILLLMLVNFCSTMSFANTDHLARAEVVSTEINTINGTMNGILKLYAHDTLEIKTALTFKLPAVWTASYTLANYVYLVAGDSLAIPFTIQYPASRLSFFPEEFTVEVPVFAYQASGQASRLVAPLNPDEVIRAVGKVYFTPYNTVELFNIRDFQELNRSWLSQSSNISTTRVFIPRASIPVSNLNLAVDTLGGKDQEDLLIKEIKINGLPYTIPMKVDPANVIPDYDDGPDSTYDGGGGGIEFQSLRLFGRFFSGTVTGRLVSTITNDVGRRVDIPLSGVFVKLKERDFLVDEDFGTTHTDAQGNFTFTFNQRQSAFEGRTIELYIEFKSKNQNFDMDARKNASGFARLYNFTQELGSFGTSMAVATGIINTDSGAMRVINWASRAWNYVENVGGYALHRGLRINPFGADSYFFGNGTFGVSVVDPVIRLTNEDGDHENTIYHEFGHFLMWNLQNKNYILFSGNPVDRNFEHGWWEENPPTLAWSEGWASAMQMILDAAHWWEDGEYGADESNRDRNASIFVYENRFDWGARINNGIASEYYMACAIYDLWDGFDTTIPASFLDRNGNTITVGHTDASTWNDNVSFSFRDILTPIVQRAGSSNKLQTIEEYFYQFRDGVIPATNCDAKLNLGRTFRENRVVQDANAMLSDTNPNAFSLSSDVISIPLTRLYPVWFPSLGVFAEPRTHQINPSNALHFSAITQVIEVPGSSSTTPLIINENLTINGTSAIPNSRIVLHSLVGSSQTYSTCGNPRLVFNYANLELGASNEQTRLEISGIGLLQFNLGARLVLSTGSRLVVKSGATLHIRTGAVVMMASGSEVIVEPGGYLCVESGATLNLSGTAGFTRQAGANLGVNPALGITTSGTCISPPTPPLNEALQFDGSNDFVNLPNTSGGFNHSTGNFTWEAWLRLTPVNRLMIISSKRVSSADGYILGVWDNGRPYIQLAGAPNILPTTATSINLYDGACHHVAVRRSGTTISFFVDGQFVSNGDYTSNRNINSTGAVRLGQDAPSGNNYSFSGWLGEFRVWNIARSNTQILNAYTSNLSTPQSGLVSYYDMRDAAASQVLSDISGNANLNVGRLGSATTADAQDPTWVSLSQVSCTVGGNFLVAQDYVSDFAPAIDSLGLTSDSAQYFALQHLGNETRKPIHPRQVVVYPNPTAEQFSLSLPEQFVDETTIELLNPSGILIKRWKVVEKVRDFDLPTGLANGMYYLRISNTHKVETIKILKK
jgi:hypothetical protein